MKILLTNDDGIFAEGINLLALALKRRGYEIMISAPMENQSCVGHGLTLRSMLYAERRILCGLEDVPCYAVSGTPVDCVRLSLDNFGFEPELIVSGINHASNLGTDTLYSGTVSAALEASMLGFPAIAVSKDTFTTEFMEDAAEYFADLLPELISVMKHEPGIGMLSVNIPSMPRTSLAGLRVAPIATQRYELRYTETENDNGRVGYTVKSIKLTECSADEISDERFVRDGYVVVTPLLYDLTDLAHMQSVKILERDAEK